MKTGLVALVAACALLFVGALDAGIVGNGKLAFVRDGKIWVVNSDGSDESVLVADPGPCASPVAWSPDGTELLYHVCSSESGTTVLPYIVNADGSGAHGIALDASQEWDPICWIGNDEIAVQSIRSQPDVSVDVWTVKTDGSNLHRLTTTGGSKQFFGPQACAADGSRIAYDVVPQNQSSPMTAYWISTEGGAPVQLSPDGESDVGPVLSPDGTHAALLRVSGGVEVVALADRSSRVVSQEAAAFEPTWSPDGRQLVFQTPHVTGYTRFGPIYEFNVHVAASDGSGERDLTSTPSQDTSPSWSPDGTRIIFNSDRDPPKNPWVMNADGTCPTSLTSTGFDDGPWQPLPGVAPAAPLRCADLAVVAAVGAPAIASGQSFDVSFTITNVGNEAASQPLLRLSAVPDHTQLVSISTPNGTCTLATMTCSLAPLNPNASAIVTFAARSTLPPSFSAATFDGEGLHGSALATPLPFRGTASASQPDGDLSDNHPTATAAAYPCTQIGPYPFTYRGTTGNDVLCGLGGPQKLYGLAGNDTVVGSLGMDFVSGGPGHDLLLGGGENDTILASDGERDVIDCGLPDRDVAIVDRRDEVEGCEIVIHPRVNCVRIGTRRNDVLTGTAKGEALCGLAGNDTIQGLGGWDQIDGGDGNDTIDGGPGRDRIFGAAGYDVILARDGERDTIDCGTQADTVIADRFDRVASNCEHVKRAG